MFVKKPPFPLNSLLPENKSNLGMKNAILLLIMTMIMNRYISRMRTAGWWTLAMVAMSTQWANAMEVKYAFISEALSAYEANDLNEVDHALSQAASPDVFALGMAAFEEGEMPLASIAFLHVLEDQPANNRARLELARAHYAMHDYDGAGHLFNEVLRSQPPDNVRRNIENFLDRIETEKQQNTWRIQFGAGVYYDDNVNYGPEATQVQVRPFSFGAGSIDSLEVQPQSRPADDYGLFMHLVLGSVHELGAPGYWRGITDVEYYQSWLSEEDRYNVLYLAGQAGLRHDTARTRFDLPVRLEQIWLDGDELVRVIGVRPEWAFSQTTTFLHLSEIKLQQKDYDYVNDRDAEYYEARHTLRNYVAKNRHQVDVYALGFYEDAEAAVFANEGFGVGIDTVWRLPRDTAVYAKVGYRSERYKERETLALEDRKDERVDLTLGLNKTITERWTADLGYIHTRNDSSFKVYEYERNLVTLSANCEL